MLCGCGWRLSSNWISHTLWAHSPVTTSFLSTFASVHSISFYMTFHCQTLGFKSCQSSVDALTTQSLTFTLPLVEMSSKGSIHIVAIHVYTQLHPHLMQDSSLPLFHQPPSLNLQHQLLHHCDHGLMRCYRSECGTIPGLISCTLQEESWRNSDNVTQSKKMLEEFQVEDEKMMTKRTPSDIITKLEQLLQVINISVCTAL